MADHPNAALIRRMHESLAQGVPMPALTELFAQDVIWHLPGRGPLAGEHRGREAVFAAMRRWFEELSGGTLRVEVRDILANDERAVALLRATGSRGEKHYDSPEVDIYQIRNGKVAEFWSYAEDQRVTDEFWS
jgi:ketosteroid isomerase-like protein